MLSIGSMIGQYKVLRVLAHTSYSHVYLVYSEALKSQFVIKMLNHENYPGSEYSQAFLLQAGIMHEFSNQAHIVNLQHIASYTALPDTHDNTDEDNSTQSSQYSKRMSRSTPYIVMPYYLQDLAQYLSLHQQKLSVYSSTCIMLQILKALKTLHAKDVIHADIKPQNIFIDETGNAYLGDFDSAHIMSSSPLLHKYTVTHTSPKTFNQAYASPEQMAAQEDKNQAQHVLNPQSDLYSLGAMWFRILTGEPLQSNHRQSIVESLSAIPKLDIPAWLLALLCEMLDENLSLRAKSADYCIEKIERFLGENERYDTELADDLASSQAYESLDTHGEPSASPEHYLSFNKTHGSFLQRALKPRIVISILIIAAVYIYWLMPGAQLTIQDNTVDGNSDTDTYAEQLVSPSKPDEKEQTPGVRQALAKADTKSSSINNINTGKTNIEESLTPIERLKLNYPTQFTVESTRTSAMHNAQNPPAAVSFVMQPIKVLDKQPQFAIMQTEVTRALYTLCVEEGACRRQKTFTTASQKNELALANYPQVRVSWFEVTEAFIPWLQSKTNHAFKLPTLSQWQQLASISLQNSAINCKDCTYQSGIFYKNSATAVASFSADPYGLYDIYGNAQEWLVNCWQELDNERCDQAMVAGGSWMDTKREIENKPIKQLLKRAASSNTGFRLVLNLYD